MTNDEKRVGAMLRISSNARLALRLTIACAASSNFVGALRRPARRMVRQRASVGRLLCACVCVVATALTTACNPIREPEYQSSDYKPKYQPQIEEKRAEVQAADLGVEDAAIAEHGQRVLSPEPSVGRFPAGLAVAQVQVCTAPQGEPRYLRVEEMEAHTSVYWGQSMNNLPPIREVRMLRGYGLDPRGAVWQALLNASLQEDCSLCLIYAKVGEAAADAEYVAVLWDAEAEKPLSVFRVPVSVPPQEREAYEKDGRHGYARLLAEASFRAESDLRALVRTALWDLVGTDTASPPTQPNPWDTDLPLFPRDYAPDTRHRVRVYVQPMPPGTQQRSSR